MVKGLVGYETMVRDETRKIKAMGRLECSLAKRRHKKPRREPSPVVDAAATQPTRFSADDLPTGDLRSISVGLKRLISAKTTAGEHRRHCFLVTEVCDRAGLLVAPKREHMAVSTVVSALEAVEEMPQQWSVFVPLLSINGTLADPLFTGSLSAEGTSTGNAMVTLGRFDVNGVAVFTLHGQSLDPVGKPASMGLSSSDFRRIQREAARLLGVRLLSEWAV